MLTDFFRETIEFVKQNNLKYRRYFLHVNQLEHRLSIILGPRGIGKTTVVAQYIHQHYKEDEALYISLDNIQLTQKYTMLEIAEEFSLNNGKLLCFDEIHKYENWSAELKIIYDKYPDIKVIATGSSALEINKGSHDLSRRAIVYNMKGMSFREFLELEYNYSFENFSLKDILESHEELTFDIREKLKLNDQKIIPLFKQYLEYGYYPYFNSLPNKKMFFSTLEQNINVSIESDLLNVYPKLNGVSIKKIKLLLAIVMKSVPFTPKISELKRAVEVKDDRTLKEYLSKLDDAGLIKLLMKSSLSMKALDKPEKIYLENTNLMHLSNPNIGNVRETFFLNQVDNYYNNKNNFLKSGIYASDKGDFFVEEKYTFEIGGKNKDFKQIKDIPNSFVISDDIESGFKNKIPLYLFGFLY